jgi:hypothetical protein
VWDDIANKMLTYSNEVCKALHNATAINAWHRQRSVSSVPIPNYHTARVLDVI